jgi:hypothetical protein
VTDWNGKNPLTGAKAPYAAAYTWTLTLTNAQGASVTKTGKITLSSILFTRTGTSVNNVATSPAPTGYMIAAAANIYLSVSTGSGSTDAIDVTVTNTQNGYFGKPKLSTGALPPFTFGPAPASIAAYLNGTSQVKARAINTFTMKGQKNVKYTMTVIQ